MDKQVFMKVLLFLLIYYIFSYTSLHFTISYISNNYDNLLIDY